MENIENTLKIIEEQLLDNNESTFYGNRKLGFDYVCFNKNGIQGSGPKDKMIELSEKINGAVAILIPVKFSN